MNDRFFVVCGTRQEFQEFITRKCTEEWTAGNNSIGMSNFVYIDNALKLKGIRNPHGWFYGTWYKLEDLHNILVQLMVATDDGTQQKFVELRHMAEQIRKSRNELL